MKKLSLLILMLLVPGASFAQGTVEHTAFYSISLGMNRSVDVYLPQGYDPAGEIDYPVIYFLHCAGGDQTGYTFLPGLLNNLISNQVIEPVIYVKPDGSVGPYYGSFYTNSELYGQFEDYIVYDLVGFIDANYRTIPTGSKRGIMGHSMGGYGSMKLGLKHPDIYRAIAAHSGNLDYSHMEDVFEVILAENGGQPPYNFAPSGVWTTLVFTWAGAFSPNMDNPPYYVDFPLDVNGDIVDSTYDRWMEHNPPKFAAELPPDTDLGIYFDCGNQDEYLCLNKNLSFADSLDQLGLAYRFQSFQGDHWNRIQTRLQIGITFLDSVMSPPTGVEDDGAGISLSAALEQNYPNPFNPQTTIPFTLPGSGNLKLEIYDLSGRLVKSLAGGELWPAGHFSINWNGTNEQGQAVVSAVYLYRLETGNFSHTKRMILLK